MPPLLKEALVSIVRYFFYWAAGYLVAKGIWTGANAELYVGAGALAVVAFVWSMWEKYKKRLWLLMASGLGRTVSINEVKELASNRSNTDNPSTLTPDNVRPNIVDNG